MRSYSIKIPLPRITYSLNLKIQPVTSKRREKTASEPRRFYSPGEQRHYEYELNKMQAVNMIQTWF